MLVPFTCAVLEYWLIHQTAHGSAHQGIAPVCPQLFQTSLSCLNIHGPMPNKAPVDFMVPDPPNTHTQAAACYQPLQEQVDESVNTQKVKACLASSEWSVVLTYLQNPEPFSHVPTKWIWERSSSTKNASPCNGFLKDISLMCWFEAC